MSPYDWKKVGDKFCVFNQDTKKKEGCSKTKEECIAHMRLLYGIEGGMVPRDQKKK